MHELLYLQGGFTSKNYIVICILLVPCSFLYLYKFKFYKYSKVKKAYISNLMHSKILTKINNTLL